MNVTPTLKRPELEMFNAVLGFADALLVNNLSFSGLLDFSVRHAFVSSLSGPEVERLRRVVKFFDDSGKDLDDSRFLDTDYAALYDCAIVAGGVWARK